ncbi:unnamed protein product [Eruca vesicaria subsp. sativa]|uniref:Uncharacterized protein n=1 Tax=Eruca vesicaria subsp. sativa TaxID=29727 RepID=A0ABC8LUB7_ERUVS|nr:unnamed protein product [Eruca vesicaria subsp. sativa]
MELGGKEIALETNDFDFGLSTQDMNKLSQDTFVDGFDPSQVKVEKVEKQSKTRAKKTSTPQLRDELIRRAGEGSPDAHWCISVNLIGKKPLRIGPAILDHEMANRLMDFTEWLSNLVFNDSDV